MNKINKLAIFCGSKTGNNPLYKQHAEELGKLLASNKISLVYGGGKKGLMGCVADNVMLHGGIVQGVIPQVLIDWEHQHESISELLVVDDMHQRKKYDDFYGCINGSKFSVSRFGRCALSVCQH